MHNYTHPHTLPLKCNSPPPLLPAPHRDQTYETDVIVLNYEFWPLFLIGSIINDVVSQ